MKNINIILISCGIIILIYFIIIVLDTIKLKHLKQKNKISSYDYLKPKTIPINGIINFDNIQLKVIEENSCKNCYFYDKEYNKINYACGKLIRTDKINVIFKKN